VSQRCSALGITPSSNRGRPRNISPNNSDEEVIDAEVIEDAPRRRKPQPRYADVDGRGGRPWAEFYPGFTRASFNRTGRRAGGCIRRQRQEDDGASPALPVRASPDNSDPSKQPLKR